MSDVKVCPTCGTEYPLSERFCPRDGSALRSQNAQGDLVGTMIAERYHIIKKLGEGGMGAVYLAEHVKMGRKSAIKVMNPGMNQDPDAIARFNREASNASRMNHPNICAIYDFGETSEGLIYLAMEFIEGQSLTSLIEQNGALPPARAASILHQTADALGVAHDYGIVHRDLKPDNIMIAKGRDNSDVVKVVDFGIAKAHTSDAQKVTKTGLVVGTPEYMSPEQLAGDKLDGRSDIYSLALVGFNMLTGTLPFVSNSAQEAMIMRLTDKPKTLAEMRPDIAWPDDVQAVFDKALARDVNERYQKAPDFGRDLSMAIERMPATAAAEAGTVVMGAQASAKTVPIAAAVPKTRVATPDDAPARVSTAARAPAAPAKSNPGMMIGIGGVVVVVVGVAIAFMSGAFGSKGAAPGGAQNAPGTKPPAQVDSQTAKSQAATSSTVADRGGDRSTKNPGDGGKSKQAINSNPQAIGGGNTPPIGSNDSPPANAVSAADLKQLDDWVNSNDATQAQRAIKLATDLLPRSQGEDKTDILYRRGLAKLLLKDDDGGCKDLFAAQDAASATSGLLAAINSMIDNQSCKKSPGPRS